MGNKQQREWRTVEADLEPPDPSVALSSAQIETEEQLLMMPNSRKSCHRYHQQRPRPRARQNARHQKQRRSEREYTELKLDTQAQYINMSIYKSNKKKKTDFFCYLL